MNNLKYSNGSATYVESLEKKIAELEKQIVAIDMNNEPVAWMYNYENFPDSFVVCRARKSDQDIPLYTHPVKEQDVKYDVTVRWDGKITHHKNVSVDTPLHYTHPVKELTDEEITICMGSLPKYNSEIVDEDLVNFARAILRKVQEK